MVDFIGPVDTVHINGTTVSGGALCVIQSSDLAAIAGKQFFYREAFTLASAGTKEFMIETGPEKTVHLSFEFDSIYVFQVEFFKATTRTGNALCTTNNRNLGSTIAATVTLHNAIAGTGADGTSIYKYKTGGAADKHVGSTRVETTAAVILAKSAKYLCRVTSFEADNLCNSLFVWAET